MFIQRINNREKTDLQQSTHLTKNPLNLILQPIKFSEFNTRPTRKEAARNSALAAGEPLSAEVQLPP
jgi:hypothetical protein